MGYCCLLEGKEYAEILERQKGRVEGRVSNAQVVNDISHANPTRAAGPVACGNKAGITHGNVE